jgi:hypothetical protein
MTTYAYMHNPNELVELFIEGYGDGETAVLSLDLDAGIVTRNSTGETLRFSTDREVYNERPQSITVPSETNTDVEYVVYKFSADPRTWVCTCPDFQHRRREMAETCKHIGWVRGYGYKRIGSSGRPINSYR